MDAAKKQKLIKALLISFGVVAILLVAGVVAVVISAKAFAAGDTIADGVSVAGVDVSGLTQASAVERLESQWISTLPEAVELSYGGKTGASSAVSQSSTNPEKVADDESAPTTGDDASANEDDARNVSVKLTRENLGVTLQLQQATAAAYRVAREGSVWQQLSTQIALRRTGVDIPVSSVIDQPTLRDSIEGLTDTVNQDPVDAEVSLHGNDVNVTPGQTGRSLDVDASVEKLTKLLVDPKLERAALVVKTREPAITQDMLAHLETVLSSYSTPFNPGKVDRTHNLRLAMGFINKTVLKPGEEFSMNSIVGPRVSEKGYKDAPIFLSGEVKPSTGGGVCQVATTLYNAALFANLKMLERHHHSRPVDYAPVGRDATVYYGQLDLRFRNSLQHPILIIGYIEGSRLYAKIIGSKSDYYSVALLQSGLATIPFKEKEIPDPELELDKKEVEKEGRVGKKATITQVVKKDGKEVERTVIHTDVYAPQTKVIRVGTKKPEVPVKPEDAAATKPGAGKKPSDKPVPGGITPARKPAPRNGDD